VSISAAVADAMAPRYTRNLRVAAAPTLNEMRKAVEITAEEVSLT
jgi:hypothetical protein